MAYDNDKDLLSPKEYEAVQAYKQAWANATTQAERDAAHAGAEAIRANSVWNYSGGDDGSKYITLGTRDTDSGGSGYSGSAVPSASTGTSYGANVDAQKALMDQWKAQALQQANAQIDYGVSTSTAELERALQDAQPQFREQAESVARDERQGLDNSALYAELRGDKGGIGQSQYNEIQAAAAQNKLAVQQAQTKLSTDTARQIEDLRAQGEFQKADAALQISQQYLSQLMSLEQWAAEYNLSAAQFEASLEQWQQNYQLSMAQLQQNQSQFNANLQYQYDALNQSGSQYQTSQLASMGQALLSAGIMPNTSQLSAMGMTSDQATQYIQAAQLAAASKSSSSKSDSSESDNGTSQDYDGLWADAQKSGNAQSYIANNYKKYGFNSSSGLYNDYKVWLSDTQDPRFLGILRVIAEQLSYGRSSNAIAKIDSVWKGLSSAQRKSVQNLLSKFGYYYNA